MYELNYNGRDMKLFYVEGMPFWEFVKENREVFKGIELSEDFKSISIIEPSDPKDLSKIIDIAYRCGIIVYNKMFDSIAPDISILKRKMKISKLLSDKILERGNATKEEAENILDQAKKLYAYASGSSLEEVDKILNKNR